jgi:Na+/H+-translocating membrane pyrophosphatase
VSQAAARWSGPSFFTFNTKESLMFVVPCIFNHSNNTPKQMQKINRKIYCSVVQTLLNVFRALLCPSSGARQTVVAAPGFRMKAEVDVFPAVVGLLVGGRCSTCFGHYYAHHQEPVKLLLQHLVSV